MAGYDLIIRGGLVTDPAQDLNQIRLDVGVRDGRIAALQAQINEPAWQVIDATGCQVLPGLIDLHAHVYTGVTYLSVDADQAALPTGTTTLVDCGTAGAATFAGLVRFIIQPARCRILAAVNISSIGLAAMPECGYAPYVDSNKALQCIRDYPDLAVAVKVRASRNALGEHGTIQTVGMALEAAAAAGVPVIAHLGEPPPAYDEILAHLRPGDIVTHCFRKGPMHCPLDLAGRIKPAVRQARERGVLFDVGHGRGSFAWRTGRLMIEQGFAPDIISTDLHIGSIAAPVAISMPDVMAKMLHLGMDWSAVVAAATLGPARSINWQDRIGSLLPGREADIAIIEKRQGSFVLADSQLEKETVNHMLFNRATIKGGQVVWSDKTELTTA
jgi:dihydroorotase